MALKELLLDQQRAPPGHERARGNDRPLIFGGISGGINRFERRNKQLRQLFQWVIQILPLRPISSLETLIEDVFRA